MTVVANPLRIIMRGEIGTKVVRLSKAETDLKIYAACRWQDPTERGRFLSTLKELSEALKEFVLHTKELLDFDTESDELGEDFSLEDYQTKWKEERDLLRTAWDVYVQNLDFHLDELLNLVYSGDIGCSEVPSILSLAGRARGGRRPLRRKTKDALGRRKLTV